MNYRRIYDALIERSHHRVLDGYYEKHHVIPRCLGGTDDPSNLVHLTAEEHYLCHQLLTKMYPNHRGLLAAAMFMTSGALSTRQNNKTYGWLRRRWSKHMIENNPGKNQKKGEEHPLHGRKFGDRLTPDGRKKISERMTGDQNPMSKVKPWIHPRATNYTKSVWLRADDLYDLWLENHKPSYCSLCRLDRGVKNGATEPGFISPYMNVVKYFRNNWNPRSDQQWLEFRSHGIDD